MSEPEFVDLPEDGRKKYPQKLESIRKGSVGNNIGRWAHLTDFDKVASARDAVRRLNGEHPSYEFTSRSNGDGTGATVYARFVGAGDE